MSPRHGFALIFSFVALFIGAALFGTDGSAFAAPRRLPPSERSGLLAPTPSFRLPDLQGKTRTLAEFHGRPVALFFFCGCEACHRCAKIWADVQRSGALPATPSVVVFSGDADAARLFLAETGMDPLQTTMLTDPKDEVAEVYHAPVCPRLFVLDRRSRLRYTNNERGTDPQTMPAAVLVSRAISAFRAADAPIQKVPVSKKSKP